MNVLSNLRTVPRISMNQNNYELNLNYERLYFLLKITLFQKTYK